MPVNVAEPDAEVDPVILTAFDRHERRRAAGSATVSALAGMMGYKQSKTDLACLAILGKAVAV